MTYFLMDMNLQEAYLREADLQGANLQEADLRGANLQGAYLREADLRGAYLQGADLRGAYLQGADLRGAYLQGAYLQGAIGIIQIQSQHLWSLELIQFPKEPMIKCGCRWFYATEATTHWQQHKDKQRRDIVIPMLEAGLLIAKAQGWFASIPE